jgi:hypothetical protein
MPRDDSYAWLHSLYGASSDRHTVLPRRVRPVRDLLAVRRAGRAFRVDGLDAAVPHLVPVATPVAEAAEPLQVVRRSAWRARVASRLLFGHQLCLFECVTVATLLRRCGADVSIVVGRLTSPVGTGLDDVHAWLEYGSAFVDGNMVPSFYTPVARYPAALDTSRVAA